MGLGSVAQGLYHQSPEHRRRILVVPELNITCSDLSVIQERCEVLFHYSDGSFSKPSLGNAKIDSGQYQLFLWGEIIVAHVVAFKCQVAKKPCH